MYALGWFPLTSFQESTPLEDNRICLFFPTQHHYLRLPHTDQRKPFLLLLTTTPPILASIHSPLPLLPVLLLSLLARFLRTSEISLLLAMLRMMSFVECFFFFFFFSYILSLSLPFLTIPAAHATMSQLQFETFVQWGVWGICSLAIIDDLPELRRDFATSVVWRVSGWGVWNLLRKWGCWECSGLWQLCWIRLWTLGFAYKGVSATV